MAQKFESIIRTDLRDSVVVQSRVQTAVTRSVPERALVDALIADAEESQHELTKRIPGMMAVEQAVPAFDWHGVTGVDHTDYARYCHQSGRWF